MQRFAGLLGLLLLFLCLPSGAALKSYTTGARPTFLTAEQAFSLTSETTEQGLLLHFHITPGYYLYRDRFHFNAEAGGTAPVPRFMREGEWKDDPSFGHIQVYHEDLDVALSAHGSGRVEVVWQGCADAGLCYPPQRQWLTLGASIPATSPAPPATASENSKATSPKADAPATATTFPLVNSSNRLLILLSLFALGLGLAFTPCVLPMLPIVSGIVAREHTSSAWGGFTLSLAYVLGVSSTYALTGLLVGEFGASANLPAWFQQPAVLVTFSLLFLLLALAMFGLYELRLPHSVQNRFEDLSRKAKGGQYLGSYVMGFFSALVVSPCVSAPLAGVLLYISTTGNAGFGALALFVLGLGMGVPLLVLGATEGRLLPKAGEWMERVKIFLGLLLVGVAIQLISRILPGAVSLLLWAGLAAISAVWLGALEPVQPGIGHLWKGLGVLCLIYSATLVLGAATGNDDPLKPLARFGSGNTASSAPAYRPVRTLAELQAAEQEAEQSHRPVMLDVYADWCVSCKEMERNVLQSPAIASTLKSYLLLRADVTANNAADRALLDHFSLVGPPAILFFRHGEEIAPARVVGYMDASGFTRQLQQVDGAGSTATSGTALP